MDYFDIYLNEHSLPQESSASANLQPWAEATKLWMQMLTELGKHQVKYRVIFPEGCLDRAFENKPFRIFIKEWIGTDKYRLLQTKLLPILLSHDTVRNVYHDGELGIGLTFAHIQGAWACSLPVEDSEWLEDFLIAEEYRVDDNGDITTNSCEIKHASCVAHIETWRQEIIDWGYTISETSKIGRVKGYLICMYSAPKEHGVAHIHVVQGSGQHTIAKYRIEPFGLMERKKDASLTYDPELHVAMGKWVATHKKELLDSWKRCMRGLHPYQIGDG